MTFQIYVQDNFGISTISKNIALGKAGSVRQPILSWNQEFRGFRLAGIIELATKNLDIWQRLGLLSSRFVGASVHRTISIRDQ